MVRKILAADLGIKIIHFYTMNLERGVKMILDELQFVPSRDITNPLPWRPSLSTKRRAESTRPIFWANRPASYLSRTTDWDEFPNGRWGSTDSPAFGEIDGYGVSIKTETATALKTWGSPTSVGDVARLFSSYCRGQVASLPWSDRTLAKETSKIAEVLADINERGFLTINSQPAVDGASSSDPIHGWGPRGGYVYQKAYVEFFCSPAALEELSKKLAKEPAVTYYAVTKAGDLRTNTTNEGPNAVTWGVFPGKEIVQPTVVEALSFMAWKTEAFELGYQWSDVYGEENDESRKLVKGLMDEWYLVNIVNNDYKSVDPASALGRFFQHAPKVVTPPPSPTTNGRA
jgi:methylenetetrahydrofolate reductase (NADPH)